MRLFEDTPDYRLMPADLEAWLRANPGATEAQRKVAFDKHIAEARQRVEAVIDEWRAEARARRLSNQEPT